MRPEDGCSCHEYIGASLSDGVCVGECDAPVHFCECVAVAVVDELPQELHLMECVGDECLSSESRVDTHEEYEVKVLDDVLQNTDGRGWTEGDPGFHPCMVYLFYSAVEVCAGLIVYVHDVCSDVFHLWDEFLGLYDHEVYVEWLAAELCDSLHDGKPERNVGYEDSVHDIKVKPVGLAVVEPLHFVLEIGEVGCQEGRC